MLLIFQSLGSANNIAIQKYMNTKKVPQLFVATGSTRFNDPKNFPWTMGWQPNFQDEARIYAKYILKEKPDAKIAVLYQNDDFGKDYLKGLKDGLGDKASSMIVAEDAYDAVEPTIDSHIVKMRSLNANVFVDITGPKFAAQAIRKAAEDRAGSPCTFSPTSPPRSVASSSRPDLTLRKGSFLRSISKIRPIRIGRTILE